MNHRQYDYWDIDGGLFLICASNKFSLYMIEQGFLYLIDQGSKEESKMIL